MSKLIKITLWKDQHEIWLLNIKKMKAKGINPDPSENAKELAKMLINCMPNGTFEYLLTSIANEIKPMLSSEDKINILRSDNDIQNRIRIALCQLANQDDDTYPG